MDCALKMKNSAPSLSPDMVLNAYTQGFFPMGSSTNPQETAWYNPPLRAVLPLDRLHISRKLRRFAARHPFNITVDTAFQAVIEGCAEPTPQRPDSWINDDIKALFLSLHQAGHAHSVEIWDENQLVGGIYGLALNAAFCAESMFSRVSGASKIALIALCARLAAGGFRLLDCQILNDHTALFGAYEITQADYLARLHRALQIPADFRAAGSDEDKLMEKYIKETLIIS